MFKKSLVTTINDLFNNHQRTFDLGKLQKHGLIKNLEDMSACPKCKSKNIAWKFFIPTDGSKPTQPSLSVCKNCGYQDLKGGFEETNKALYRENKINKILDEKLY